MANNEITNLPLSVRGLRALRKLKVSTVRQFVSLDLAETRRLNNCGAVTLEQLASLQEQLRARSGYHLKAMRALVKQPAALNSWRRLPLFSGSPFSGIGPADFHKTYRADFPVERLLEGAGAKWSGKPIRSLGELLLAPGLELAARARLADRELDRVRAAVDGFLKRSLGRPLRTKLNSSSPSAFLASLVEPVVDDDRQRRVLLDRMGWRSAPRTLAAIGDQLGITRERVRQIENKALRKLGDWQAVEALRPLHDLIVELLADRTEAVDLRGIGKALQDRYGWSDPLPTEAVARFLPAFPDLKHVKGYYVSLRALRRDRAAGRGNR